MHVVRLPGFRYREAASWLGEWQEEHGLNGATVVGHSMGGTVALALAAERPHLVRRLALIAPAGIFSTQARRAFAFPLARSVLRSPPRLVFLARDIPGRPDPPLAGRKRPPGLRYRLDLHQVQAPT